VRRPDGFERPLEQPAEDAARDGRGAQQGVAADVREVIRLDALRRRRDEARRSAAEADWDRPTRPEPRRWALSAYADLGDEDAAADVERVAPGERGAGTAEDGGASAEMPDGLPAERGSHAQRVDRAWRKAQREQRRLDRAEMDDAKREAKAAKRARARKERAEVRRFTATRRRQLRAALLSAGGLGLSLALLVALVWSPLMAVREVQVEGAERIDAAAVQQALADQVGQPIATVTEAGVAERLQAIPQIESFRLDVVPPSTVIVRLVERRPVAIIETDAGASVIDAAGVVLGQVDDTTAALPRLDGVEVGSEQFEAVATVLVSVPADVLEATESIAAPTPSDIRLTLATGQTVQWGGAEQSPLKADVVAALMATQDPAAAAVLDVRAPEHPVVHGASADPEAP
jgi:cell division protein FtsQ